MTHPSIHPRKIIAWTLFLTGLQVALLILIEEAGSAYAASQGREFRHNLNYGITHMVAFLIFGVAAFVLPIFWIGFRSKWPGVVCLLGFLVVWCVLLVPNLSSYPYRASFLLLQGIVSAIGIGCLIPRYIRNRLLKSSRDIPSTTLAD